MQVVILCGGKGERIREHIESLPKPLIDIGGKPILWHIMKIYSHYGYNDFILCLGYKGEKIKEYFSQNNDENWKIELVDTGLDTNTGGRMKKIEKYIKNDVFMATYADGLSDINIQELVDHHKKSGKIATMTCVNLRSNFGIVSFDENNIVSGFKEKPFTGMWINAGFFVFNKKIFNYLENNSILETLPMEKLSKDKQLIAFVYKGFWEGMDTYKDTRMLNKAYNEGNAKWMTWDKNVKA